MKRFDIVIIILVVIIALGSLGVLAIRPQGNYSRKYVEIYSENRLYRKIPFDKTTTERVVVKSNLGFNIIDISNAKVRIIDADCPDKICIKDGAISKPGDMLVCLPNKVVVEIKGESNSENDALSF
ncbi:NusG domain II-containing protein [Fonticella tunisiensis]|uniref:Uncharacterized protein n=1 Tax=Fonticella tunisiensis TaxID=1096341 RepID=A0A4R7KQL5_9CLOT|nr:NusG domain II-containing protein [Fonticella tunisiensis]TDT60996.1 hypothetical protein EDD71_110114 [Fonticella tunisiensis]